MDGVRQVLEAEAAKEGVNGVLLADSNGLALGATGLLKLGLAGVATSLASRAASLDDTGAPVVLVETEKAVTKIMQQGGVTVAVKKANNA